MNMLFELKDGSLVSVQDVQAVVRESTYLVFVLRGNSSLDLRSSFETESEAIAALRVFRRTFELVNPPAMVHAPITAGGMD